MAAGLCVLAVVLAALALGWLAVSFGVDGIEGALGWEPSGWHLVVEDGAKFLGIIAWLLLHWQVAVRALVSVPGSQHGAVVHLGVEDAGQPVGAGSLAGGPPQHPDDAPRQRRVQAKAEP